MRNGLIKVTNFGLVIAFGLLIVLLPRNAVVSDIKFIDHPDTSQHN